MRFALARNLNNAVCLANLSLKVSLIQATQGFALKKNFIIAVNGTTLFHKTIVLKDTFFSAVSEKKLSPENVYLSDMWT